MMTEEELEFVYLNVSEGLFQWSNVTKTDLLDPPSSQLIVCLLSLVFAVVGVVGVVGNSLVGAAIVGDARMRRSPTNALILNLAVADLVIMLACVPDIVQFIGNRGWRLGLELCKVLRFTEVFALYASVMTLLTLCIERYIAIVHPIRAHILCCRSRIVPVLVVIWPVSMLCACPNLIYHVILELGPDFTPCVMHFPYIMALKYTESIVFYFIPLVIQVALYVKIGRCLYQGGAALQDNGTRHDSLLKARRGVVKMLVAGVTVYFVSFSPHQVLLLYNAVSPKRFRETWSFLILVNLMAYSSSACNPLLYSAFSHKFRRKFKQLLGPCECCQKLGSTTTTANNNIAPTTQPSIFGRPSCLGSCSKASRGRSVKTTVTEI